MTRDGCSSFSGKIFNLQGLSETFKGSKQASLFKVKYFIQWWILLQACLFLLLGPDLATLRPLLITLSLASAAFLRSGL